nr:hypothetical protein GCM10020241_03830 [Streptoalloteichus tenebrarius]
MLEQTLVAMLAVDGEDLLDARVWMAFTAQATLDPALAEVQRGHYAGLTELLTVLLRTGQESGQIRAEVEPETEAEALIALADGLTVQVLLGRHSPESARAAIRRRTTALLRT